MSGPEDASEGPHQDAPLVLDTSVAVKFYVPEEGHKNALEILVAAESGKIELVAPGTLLPEGFNAVWQYHRRGEVTLDEVRKAWTNLRRVPVVLYTPEDLMPRAAEIALETSVIVYDALFLALAEDADTVGVTADGKLLKALRDASYAQLAHPLSALGNLIPNTG